MAGEIGGDALYSSNTTFQGANTDPAVSIGGHFSTSTVAAGGHLYSVESTLTSTMTDPKKFIDTVQIGAGHLPGERVVFVSGNNEDLFGVVEAFNDSTGEFTLRDPMPAFGTSGDDYRLASSTKLFDELDWADIESGDHVSYRVVHLFHGWPGGGLPLPEVFIETVEAAEGQTLELAVQKDTDQSGQITNIPTMTDQFDAWTDVDNGRLTPYSTLWSSEVGGFENAGTTAVAQPHKFVFMNPNTSLAIFLRRTVKQGSPPGVGTWRLRFEITNSLGLHFASSPVVSRVNAYTPTVNVSTDRKVWTGGGTRFTTTVKGPNGVLPLPNRSVRFGVKSGDPGTMSPQTVITDSDGVARSVYSAPASGGLQSADVEVSVINPAVL